MYHVLIAICPTIASHVLGLIWALLRASSPCHSFLLHLSVATVSNRWFLNLANRTLYQVVPLDYPALPVKSLPALSLSNSAPSSGMSATFSFPQADFGLQLWEAILRRMARRAHCDVHGHCGGRVNDSAWGSAGHHLCRDGVIKGDAEQW